MKNPHKSSFKRDKRKSTASPVFEEPGSRDRVQESPVANDAASTTPSRGRRRLDTSENPFFSDSDSEMRTTTSPKNGDSRPRRTFDSERPVTHTDSPSSQNGVQRSQRPSISGSDLPEDLRRRASRTASIVVPSGEGFIRRLKPTLVLQNSGSVARDHLASERTFLAYVRTSLAIASSGVGLVQLFSLSGDASGRVLGIVQRSAPELGATLVGFGIAVLFVGIARYFTIQSALTQGNFPVARLVVLAISSTLIVLTTVVFAVLLAGRIAARAA